MIHVMICPRREIVTNYTTRAKLNTTGTRTAARFRKAGDKPSLLVVFVDTWYTSASELRQCITFLQPCITIGI